MLPVKTDYLPMEAKKALKLPARENWQYEPKWDGFRCLAFKYKDQIELMSKNGQSLNRYFPELIESLSKMKAKQFVLDGEITVAQGMQFSFNKLLSSP